MRKKDNNMQILKMMFIANDPNNLGYLSGGIYTLCVMSSLEKIIVFCAENPEGYCTYSDVNQFFQDWRLA